MTDQRVRLAAIDPAADLPPLDPAARAALLGRAVSSTSAVPRSRRVPRIVVAGLAAAAVTATGLLLVPQLVRPPAVTLTVPDASQAQCAPLGDFAAAALTGATRAFAGEVTSVTADRVTVRVTRVYRGGPAGEALLDLPAQGAEDFTAFRPGERVLVAASGGQVAGCGLSGEASPDLQRYYDTAFG